MRFRDRSCPVCGDNGNGRVFFESNYDKSLLNEYAFSARKGPEFMHYRIIECPVCDLLYASPAPFLEDISQEYKKADFDSLEEANYAARTYSKILPKVIPSLPDLDGAMDIGTGNGAFLECMLDAGFSNVVGVEPSFSPVQAAKKEIKPLIRVCMFSPHDYKPESFSLITCFQTLEHVDAPLSLCRSIYSLLKKGGVVLFVTHNCRTLFARILGEKWPIFDIEHLQLFSPQSLKFMLENASFEDTLIASCANTYPLGYWVKLTPFRDIIKERVSCIFKRIGILKVPLPMFVGNIATIAYKN
jgi:SAM-dependent methyltransferase